MVRLSATRTFCRSNKYPKHLLPTYLEIKSVYIVRTFVFVFVCPHPNSFLYFWPFLEAQKNVFSDGRNKTDFVSARALV